MIKLTELEQKQIQAINIRNQISIQQQVIQDENTKTYRKPKYYNTRIDREYKNLEIMKTRLSKVNGEIQIIKRKTITF
jgi:hypothetical protein